MLTTARVALNMARMKTAKDFQRLLKAIRSYNQAMAYADACAIHWNNVGKPEAHRARMVQHERWSEVMACMLHFDGPVEIQGPELTEAEIEKILNTPVVPNEKMIAAHIKAKKIFQKPSDKETRTRRLNELRMGADRGTYLTFTADALRDVAGYIDNLEKALQRARKWGISHKNFHAFVAGDLGDWVDAGMTGPLPEITSPLAKERE